VVGLAGRMPDALLITVPLMVLAVILVLGFAGCKFKHGSIPEPEPPTPTLTFRATVPTALTVEPPGVKFAWTRPGAAMEESATVPAPSGTEAGNNVYDHEIPPGVGEDALEPGGWLGRCEMTVRADGQLADATSGDCTFDLPAVSESYVLLFKTLGGPLAPPFRVICMGRTPWP
jgi:hypothetical protein